MRPFIFVNSFSYTANFTLHINIFSKCQANRIISTTTIASFRHTDRNTNTKNVSSCGQYTALITFQQLLFIGPLYHVKLIFDSNVLLVDLQIRDFKVKNVLFPTDIYYYLWYIYRILLLIIRQSSPVKTISKKIRLLTACSCTCKVSATYIHFLNKI